jgi:hypothetical protein
MVELAYLWHQNRPEDAQWAIESHDVIEKQQLGFQI